jgi:signal transduction histidine kinase
MDGHELTPSEVAEVPGGTNSLEIDYTATTLAMAERVRFRYQLEGVDRAWQDVGSRRRAYYTDLRPGSYDFRVSADVGDGNWIDVADTWSFRVLPAWYQSSWFRALVVVLIGSVGGLVVAIVQRRRYLRSQAELEHQYEAVLAERARIADDLHDTLLQGFTGVNLQLIAAELAIRTQPDVAAATLVRVQRLTEDSLREARERVWEMRDAVLPSGDLATALGTIARDRTAGTAITVDVTTNGNARRLPRTVEDAAFRIGREAIVNSVRHAKASRIEIHLDYRPMTLALEIRDDGRGVNAGEAAEARKQGHFGLDGIQNRASLMGGRCEVRPGSTGGTVVALELPIAHA